jgi:heptosyltransferase-2
VNHASRITHCTSRILVRGVNWLGDAVMSTPALLRLQERFPEAQITLVTPDKLRELWLRHPAVNDVISFADGDGLVTVSRRLKGRKFNLAVVLPNSPRAALEVWLAQIPRRVGHARPWRNWLLTELVRERPGAVTMRKRSIAEIHELTSDQARPPVSSFPYPASAHHIHHYLHLVAALGANPKPLAPRLVVSDDEVTAVREKFGLSEGSEGGRPVFALNPGAEYGPAKRWPVERFIETARRIQQRTNCLWQILGGRGDVALANQIDSALRAPHAAVRNLAGQTTLRELMALLKLCRVLLTNDTGPMHVAAALGTPVVAPFGSTSPELTGPGLPGDPRLHLLKSDAPCAPCFLRECPIDFRCMKGISVERTVEAVLRAAVG